MKIESVYYVKYGRTTVSHTPDQDFYCFYPWEIILPHIPVPVRGKNKTEQVQVGHTSFLDHIVIIK